MTIQFVRTETERLIVRPYQPGEAQDRQALIKEAFGAEQPLAEVESWLEWTILSHHHLAALEQPPYGDYAVELKATGHLIGSVGIVPLIVAWDVFDEPPPEVPLASAEFGLFWAVRSAHQRQGYATEAARALIDYLFDDLHVRKVVATTCFDNTASMRVMQKLGMTLRDNPLRPAPWFQVIGVLDHPHASS